jgi:hypothetical protein
MPEEKKSSHCIHCLEPIQEGAKSCPHCMKWQTKFIDPTSRNFVLFLTLMLLPFLLIIAMAIFTSSKPSVVYNPSMRIVSSGFGVEETERRTFLAGYGEIENLTDMTFGTIDCQIRFYNAKGELIDVLEEELYQKSFPKSKVCFKLNGMAVKPKGEYAKCEVTIPWAEKYSKFRH